MRAANDDVERAAADACEGLLSDLFVDTMGRLELLQREAWARELGLDPATADLLALPPVPREVAPANDEGLAELLARASA